MLAQTNKLTNPRSSKNNSVITLVWKKIQPRLLKNCQNPKLLKREVRLCVANTLILYLIFMSTKSATYTYKCLVIHLRDKHLCTEPKICCCILQSSYNLLFSKSLKFIFTLHAFQRLCSVNIFQNLPHFSAVMNFIFELAYVKWHYKRSETKEIKTCTISSGVLR